MSESLQAGFYYRAQGGQVLNEPLYCLENPTDNNLKTAVSKGLEIAKQINAGEGGPVTLVFCSTAINLFPETKPEEAYEAHTSNFGNIDILQSYLDHNG
ncbi:MAG: hypothetical protein K9G62_00670 [Alphaproteobacteria bacterium]|nr:hypothetical protein [Alphaproteobacteria bacterium]